MRLPRFEGLRRRLSYANVMATLAFFFALTGGAMAATKYLVATDTIPATSDLAGSTYGNPVIASGKVTTGKIADGAITSAKFAGSALAPNADKLDGQDSTAFAKVVAKGDLTIDLAPPPGACRTVATGAPAGADPSTDFVVLETPTLDGVTFSAYLLANQEVGDQIVITLCNGNAGSLSTVTFHYLILR